MDLASYSSKIGFLPGKSAYWPGGAYSVQCLIKGTKTTMESDQIDFFIIPVPSQYQHVFDELVKFKIDPRDFDRYSLYQKYKDTIYRQEFLEKILFTLENRGAIIAGGKNERKNIVQQYCREYILSYPNTLKSQTVFQILNDNYQNNTQFLDSLHQGVKSIDTTKTSGNRNLLLRYIESNATTKFKDLTNNGKK